MNSIQKYVLNSLFVRNQITEEKLAQALDTFSNEPAIDAFLSVLITGEETKKDVLLTIIGTATRKLQAIKVLKDLFGIRSFTWRKSEKGNDFWLNLFNKARLI